MKCSNGRLKIKINFTEDFIDGSTRTGQEAIICRLNSTLFDEVVKVLKDKPRAQIGFAGTAKMPVSISLLCCKDFLIIATNVFHRL